MLLPESMSRMVIVGTKARMREAIDAFYAEESLHLIDHATGDDGLSIGSPTPNTSKASERLLKVRAMEKELGISKKTKTADVSVEDLRQQISDGDVESVEKEVLEAVDARNDLTQKITDLNLKKNTLEILERLPLSLDLYSGYRSVAVLVGTTVADAGKLSVDDAEVFSDFDKKKGGVVAVFVKNESKGKAADALSEYGFSEIAVPDCGSATDAASALRETESQIQQLTAERTAAELTLESLRSKYMSFLQGTDEELSIEVEKGSLPLRIAVSEYSYVMDAWVPTKKVDAVKADLEGRLGDDVYVECEETRGRRLADSEGTEENPVDPRFKTVPTKQRSGKIAKEFEYATSLVSLPKYQEVDPTNLIMIFLPLMFGYMVGDVGYAIPFIILGLYGIKKTHHKDWRSIAIVLFFGGVWSAIFGLFFYGEFLGMHFVGGYYDAAGQWTWLEDSVALGGTSVTWDWILGGAEGHFPQWFMDMMPSFDHGAEGIHTGVGKLVEIGFLLKLAVYVGIVHLTIGYACAIYNAAIQRGAKHAFLEQGGTVLSFFGVICLCWTLTRNMIYEADMMAGTEFIVLLVAIVLVAAGVVVSIKGRGAMEAIMDLPEHLGHVLSYTRLAAIAMSKAGMALAFNYIVFDMIMPTTTVTVNGVELTQLDPSAGIVMVILGILMFGFLHLVVWTLAILSGGLHALRLQYVELMTRFFDGNGVAFAPLREARKKTFFKTKSEKITPEV